MQRVSSIIESSTKIVPKYPKVINDFSQEFNYEGTILNFIKMKISYHILHDDSLHDELQNESGIYDDQHHDDDFHHTSYDELGCDDCSSLRGDDCALCSDCDDSFDGDNGHSSQCDDDHDGCVHDDCCAHEGDDDDDQSSDVCDADDDNDHDPHLTNDVCCDCTIDCAYVADDTLTGYDDHRDSHRVHDDVLHSYGDDHN